MIRFSESATQTTRYRYFVKCFQQSKFSFLEVRKAEFVAQMGIETKIWLDFRNQHPTNFYFQHFFFEIFLFKILNLGNVSVFLFEGEGNFLPEINHTLVLKDSHFLRLLYNGKQWDGVRGTPCTHFAHMTIFILLHHVEVFSFAGDEKSLSNITYALLRR